MELNFEDICIIVKADTLEFPEGLRDDDLFELVKNDVIELLQFTVAVEHVGYAPDNTADSNDDLLYNGQLLRVICNEKYLGVGLDEDTDSIQKAFISLIKEYNPFWTTIIVERGFIKEEITLELLYKEPFRLE